LLFLKRSILNVVIFSKGLGISYIYFMNCDLYMGMDIIVAIIGMSIKSTEVSGLSADKDKYIEPL